MKSVFKSVFDGLCVSALFLLVLSVSARAQVAAHSGEVAGSAGYNAMTESEQDGNLNEFLYGSLSGDSANHPYYGASGGYNVNGLITLLGEYKYQPLGSMNLSYCCSLISSTAHSHLFGGGVRLNFLNSTKVVPFALITLGNNRYSVNAGGTIVNLSGEYEDIGGGLSYYIRKNFGVRPEFRYEMQQINSYSGGLTGGPVEVDRFLAAGSVFFQWGGHGKKKASSTK
jgi:hypothetical protein